MRVKGEMTVKTNFGDMIVKVADITPEDAAEMLTHNIGNRNISLKALQSYSRDLVKGYWKANGVSIIFNDAGTLIDGQHRLTAVVKTGLILSDSIIVTVPESQGSGIDQGKRRSARDQAKMQGLSGYIYNSNTVISTVKELIIHGKGTTANPTNDEIFEFMKSHEEECEFIRYNLECKCTNTAGLKNSTLFSVVLAALLSGEDIAKLERFCYIYTTGMCDEKTPGEPTVIALRNHTISKSKSSGSGMVFRRDLYCRAQNALNKFLNGTTLYLIKPTSKEYYFLDIRRNKND